MAESQKSLKSVALEAVVVGLVTGVIGGVVIGIPATVASNRLGAALDNQATCENPQELTLLRGDSIQATGEYLTYATSNGPLSYPPGQLVDGTRSTAWVSNRTDDLGVGATVTLSLLDETDVRLICVLNGYAKGADYEMNASVQVVGVATDRGKRDASLPPLDAENAFDYQALTFAPGKTRTITLTVLVVDPPVHPDPAEGPVSATMSEVEVWTSAGGRLPFL